MAADKNGEPFVLKKDKLLKNSCYSCCISNELWLIWASPSKTTTHIQMRTKISYEIDITK